MNWADEVAQRRGGSQRRAVHIHDFKETDMLPTAYLPDSDRPLSRPVYAVLAIACAVMGLWASIITLRYFKHGAMILEADDASRVLALAAATMFVFAEMGAFGLFSLLPAQRMYDLRWKLITFVVAVLALEIVTTVAVQMAMTKSADMTQQAGAQRAQDLRRQITQAETEATALRAQAGQLANSEHSWVKAGAPKVAAMAASAAAKTDGLYAELAKVDSTQHPTLIGLFGEDWAMAYAIARGVLVSCAGLLFWGAVGALWRGFMSGNAGAQYTPPTPPAMPEPIHYTPPPAPQPAAPALPPQPAPQPASAPNFAPNWKGWGAGAGAGALALGLGALATAPSNAEAATVPTVQPVGGGVAKSEHLGAAKPEHPAEQVRAPEKVPEEAVSVVGEGVAKPEHSTEHQSDSGEAGKVSRRGAAVGVKVDTGTGERDGYRYRRVRAAVKAGKLRPSIRAIQKAEGGSDKTVRGYLAELEREGVTVVRPDGRGWQVKTQAS